MAKQKIPAEKIAILDPRLHGIRWLRTDAGRRFTHYMYAGHAMVYDSNGAEVGEIFQVFQVTDRDAGYLFGEFGYYRPRIPAERIAFIDFRFDEIEPLLPPKYTHYLKVGAHGHVDGLVYDRAGNCVGRYEEVAVIEEEGIPE